MLSNESKKLAVKIISVMLPDNANICIDTIQRAIDNLKCMRDFKDMSEQDEISIFDTCQRWKKYHLIGVGRFPMFQ